jgi:predicted TIM-barrel fold metal-dependent hydrolase
VSTLRASYAEAVEVSEQLVASLAAGERAAVFGDTARRWYGL